MESALVIADVLRRRSNGAMQQTLDPATQPG